MKPICIHVTTEEHGYLVPRSLKPEKWNPQRKMGSRLNFNYTVILNKFSFVHNSLCYQTNDMF